MTFLNKYKLIYRYYLHFNSQESKELRDIYSRKGRKACVYKVKNLLKKTKEVEDEPSPLVESNHDTLSSIRKKEKENKKIYSSKCPTAGSRTVIDTWALATGARDLPAVEPLC